MVLLIQIGTTSMFGTEALGFTSVGPIAVLVSALVAGFRWKKEHISDEQVNYFSLVLFSNLENGYKHSKSLSTPSPH